MNLSSFSHYQEIGDRVVRLIIVGYLSSDKKEFDITSITSKWKGFDPNKVSEDTKEFIVENYLNLD